MNQETELVTVGQTQIEATRGPDGKPYANLRRLCEDLGLDLKSQHRKLSESRWSVMVNLTTTGKDGKRYEMTFISADTIPMWLATINANKVAPDVRPALHVIQDECRDALYRHFSGNSLIPVDQQLIEMRMDIGELQKKYADMMGKMLEIAEQTQRNQQELLEYVKRIDERTKGKREGFSPEIQRKYVRCVDRFYRGACPCCQSKQIVEDDTRIPYVAEMEHYHHRSMNRLEHGWLVCKTCNGKLRKQRDKPNSYWFQSMPAFQQFQRLLHQSDDDQMMLWEDVA